MARRRLLVLTGDVAVIGGGDSSPSGAAYVYASTYWQVADRWGRPATGRKAAATVPARGSNPSPSTSGTGLRTGSPGAACVCPRTAACPLFRQGHCATSAWLRPPALGYRKGPRRRSRRRNVVAYAGAS